MTKLFYAASAAAILTVAGHLPAMAQSSTTGTMSPMITCRDISTMDRDMARSVVFYVSGFQAASGQMQASASGTSGTAGSTSADTGTSGTSGTSGSTSADAGTSGTSGSSDSTSTAADAGSTTSGSSGSDVTGSTSSAGGTTDAGGTASGSSTTASGASSGASSTVVAQLPGFGNVDIDKIMSDCANSPDRQISEMIGQAGSTTGTGTTTP